MKDARGHGSNQRNGPGSLNGIEIAPTFHAPKAGAGMRSSRDFKTDADRTVADLRSRLSNTGPGHSVGLVQGIRNLFGG